MVLVEMFLKSPPLKVEGTSFSNLTTEETSSELTGTYRSSSLSSQARWTFIVEKFHILFNLSSFYKTQFSDGKFSDYEIMKSNWPKV